VGVDVDARHQIWGHIRALRQAGRTVLLSTNHLDEAEALCDRVAMLREGRLLAEDAPAAFIAAAGRCLDLDCAPEHAETLVRALGGHPHLLRLDRAPGGLTLHVEARCDIDEVVRRAMEAAPLQAFRARPPDLAEVYRALSAPAPAPTPVHAPR
jgi:ABC-2 type transport system ATP-binding protein